MSTSTVADVAAWLTNAMLLVGPLTLLLGVFLHHNRGIAAPYGRFASKAAPGWGPLLPGRLAWVVRCCCCTHSMYMTVQWCSHVLLHTTVVCCCSSFMHHCAYVDALYTSGQAPQRYLRSSKAPSSRASCARQQRLCLQAWIA